MAGAGCLWCRHAAALSPNGCRLAQGALRAGQISGISARYGDEMIDYLIEDMHDFPIDAAVFFYDDSAAPNAVAIPDVSRGHADGTVLLGRTLIQQVNRLHVDELRYGYKRYGQVNYNVDFILAHELAHVLQFKKGMFKAGWQVEPHADFLAGWSYGQSYNRNNSQDKETKDLQLEEGVKTIFNTGDTKFGDSQHHGEPQFRAAMVRAGFRSARLDVHAAFAEGMKFAGLA
jgi:hypothetical protein